MVSMHDRSMFRTVYLRLSRILTLSPQFARERDMFVGRLN